MTSLQWGSYLPFNAHVAKFDMCPSIEWIYINQNLPALDKHNTLLQNTQSINQPILQTNPSNLKVTSPLPNPPQPTTQQNLTSPPAPPTHTTHQTPNHQTKPPQSKCPPPKPPANPQSQKNKATSNKRNPRRHPPTNKTRPRATTPPPRTVVRRCRIWRVIRSMFCRMLRTRK